MSKKLILSLALSGLVLTSTAQTTVAPAIPRDEKIEQQIETLLKKMTLDEKVGQMCELTIDLLQKRANPFAGLNPKDITVDDLKKIVKRYKLEKEFKLGKEMPSQEVMMQLVGTRRQKSLRILIYHSLRNRQPPRLSPSFRQSRKLSARGKATVSGRRQKLKKSRFPVCRGCFIRLKKHMLSPM